MWNMKTHKLWLLSVLLLCNIECYSFIPSDTVTYWRISVDSTVVLRGNEASSSSMLPGTIVNLNDDFNNIYIEVFADTSSFKKSQISLFEGKTEIFQNSYSNKIVILKTDIEKLLEKPEHKILFRYSDDDKTGIYLAQIIFTRE